MKYLAAAMTASASYKLKAMILSVRSGSLRVGAQPLWGKSHNWKYGVVDFPLGKTLLQAHCDSTWNAQVYSA